MGKKTQKKEKRTEAEIIRDKCIADSKSNKELFPAYVREVEMLFQTIEPDLTDLQQTLTTNKRDIGKRCLLNATKLSEKPLSFETSDKRSKGDLKTRLLALQTYANGFYDHYQKHHAKGLPDLDQHFLHIYQMLLKASATITYSFKMQHTDYGASIHFQFTPRDLEEIHSYIAFMESIESCIRPFETLCGKLGITETGITAAESPWIQWVSFYSALFCIEDYLFSHRNDYAWDLRAMFSAGWNEKIRRAGDEAHRVDIKLKEFSRKSGQSTIENGITGLNQNLRQWLRADMDLANVPLKNRFIQNEWKKQLTAIETAPTGKRLKELITQDNDNDLKLDVAEAIVCVFWGDLFGGITAKDTILSEVPLALNAAFYHVKNKSVNLSQKKADLLYLKELIGRCLKATEACKMALAPTEKEKPLFPVFNVLDIKISDELKQTDLELKKAASSAASEVIDSILAPILLVERQKRYEAEWSKIWESFIQTLAENETPLVPEAEEKGLEEEETRETSENKQTESEPEERYIVTEAFFYPPGKVPLTREQQKEHFLLQPTQALMRQVAEARVCLKSDYLSNAAVTALETAQHQLTHILGTQTNSDFEGRVLSSYATVSLIESYIVAAKLYNKMERYQDRDTAQKKALTLLDNVQESVKTVMQEANDKKVSLTVNGFVEQHKQSFSWLHRCLKKLSMILNQDIALHQKEHFLKEIIEKKENLKFTKEQAILEKGPFLFYKYLFGDTAPTLTRQETLAGIRSMVMPEPYTGLPIMPYMHLTDEQIAKAGWEHNMTPKREALQLEEAIWQIKQEQSFDKQFTAKASEIFKVAGYTEGYQSRTSQIARENLSVGRIH